MEKDVFKYALLEYCRLVLEVYKRPLWSTKHRAWRAGMYGEFGSQFSSIPASRAKSQQKTATVVSRATNPWIGNHFILLQIY